MSSFRSQPYRIARTMGNVNAVKRGPGASAKRIACRQATKRVNGAIGKMFR